MHALLRVVEWGTNYIWALKIRVFNTLTWAF